ncbi:hypothetical protein EDC96DRAFT_542477 [Choanephora cucurbitarum]|nr:hypothetical protein EDC96DRAFT_542477 [Choanephora cucurbitarum]
MATELTFANNFWENIDKNGITILMERMRGAKQTCERFKNAYEARALLEEEYGKTLLQIAQKQKPSSTENGSSQAAMNTVQKEFMSIAESHIHLANLLRENVSLPLTKLLDRQKSIRKELQTSIQKLYNKRQLQAHFVRRAHKRHNLEIEKANLLVQQQTNEKDKLAKFKSAEITIDKLKKIYDEGLVDLKKVTDEWNDEWRKTCENFEKLEQERLEFFKSNLSNCANLMLGSLENEIQACERINSQAMAINVEDDLAGFVKENKSSSIVPSPIEYIKIHAYYDANQEKESKYTSQNYKEAADNDEHSESEERFHTPIRRKRASTISELSNIQKDPSATAASIDVVDNLKIADGKINASPAPEIPSVQEPVLIVGVMEVYPSDEEDDEEEYEYITETESENEDEKNDSYDKPDEAVEETTLPNSPEEDSSNTALHSGQVELLKEEADIPKADTDASSGKPFVTSRLSSFVKEVTRSPSDDREKVDSNLSVHLEQYNTADHEYDVTSPSEAAAFELDDMLRKLDAKRIGRAEEENAREQANVRPTASISSPSASQRQQNRRSYIPSQYYQSKQSSLFNSTSSRRMSTIETAQSSFGSLRSNSNEFYDPFNSLSSKETTSDNNSSKRRSFVDSSTYQQPSAQTIRERMLLRSNNEESKLHQSNSSSQNLHDVTSKNYDSSVGSISTLNTMGSSKKNFVDYAIALYDYDMADEGEISFREGDLLGIISKSKDEEQGWWEASLLNRKNQKVVQSGLVPSNFLELVAK